MFYYAIVESQQINESVGVTKLRMQYLREKH